MSKPLGKAAPPGKAPPPPKAKAGCARPPPPPLLGKRPTPPSGLTAAAPGEVVGGPKLRPLFWTAVAQVPPESVWADLLPPAPFDQAQLECQFALSESRTLPSARKGVTGGAAGGGGTATPREEPRKRLRVLDDRTSQLLAIAFNRLPPPEQLATVVNTLEDFPESLPAEAVLALHSAASEQREAVEQLRQLEVAEADLAQLDLPERYLWVLGTVPACAAKLACGALIVGPARELVEIRAATEKVCSCCRTFRSSELMRKCISTALAIGNFMNRGTPRSSARGVVLPDSFLKLEELRGASPAEDSIEGGGRSPSLLDFVAQAVVNEVGARRPKELVAEVEAILQKASAARTVSLEEAESSCQQVCAAATRAWQALGELPVGAAGIKLMSERVRSICEEANTVAGFVKLAKEELSSTQRWSSAKGKSEGDKWFTGWAQFLESLAAALGRAQPPPPPVPPVPATRAALSELNVTFPVCGAKQCDKEPPLKPVGVAAPAAPQPERKNVMLDDDVRAEDLFKLMKKGSPAVEKPQPQAPPGVAEDASNRSRARAATDGHLVARSKLFPPRHDFDDKENLRL
mmetsp:Transcript_43804/g.91134  ORF Transcript_43804/g.91134 Transcript_43804/m.91134 type:complete len:577 (+) Transcript_43804:62-1792(+)